MDKRKTGPLGVPSLVKNVGTVVDEPATLESLSKRFKEHAELDEKKLTAIETKQDAIEKKIGSATKGQNWFISILIAIFTAIGAVIHGYLGH